jgi:hypothetical protein
MNKYLKGQRILLYVDFKDKFGAAANGTVTLQTIAPGTSTPVTRSQTNPSTGRYEFEFTLTGAEYLPGVWRYRYSSTGNVEASFEGEFELEPSKF